MLNKKFTAVLLASTVLTGAAFATEQAKEPSKEPLKVEVTRSGEVRAFVEYGNADGKELSVESTDTKFGVKAKSNGVIYGFGELNVAADINGSDVVTTDYGYVGIGNSRFGELSLGKQKSLAAEFANQTDVFYNAGNSAVQKPGDKVTKSVKYMGTFGPVSVGGLVSMDDTTSEDDHVDFYQVGVGVLGFGASISQDQSNDSTWYNVGYAKKFGKVSVAATYSIADADSGAGIADMIMYDSDKTTNVTRGYEVAFGFDVTDKISVLGGFQDTDVAGDDGTMTAQVTYTINDHAVAFSNVDFARADETYVIKTGLSFVF